MRPIAIEFQAFGSYPGTVAVDFTVLANRGLFVVTGDTGTGKTTIFDAMTYALYGTMPRKDGKDIRSHHADLHDETYVEFTFECDDVRYVARRQPDQVRPAKRGSGTAEMKATALLVRTDGPGASTPIATKATEMTAECTALVGLKAEQFQRVILLPQGEVEKFLLANSKDREDLLGQLFGGQVFDVIVEELKSRESTLRVQVGGANTQIDHELANAASQVTRLADTLGVDLPEAFDPTDHVGLRTSITAMDVPLAGLVARADAAAATVQAATVARTTAQAAADRFDQALDLRARLAALAVEDDRVAADEALVDRSARARPVIGAADALAAVTTELAHAVGNREARLEQIASVLAPVGVSPETASFAQVDGALRDLADSVAGQRALLDDHARALQGVADADATHAALVADSDAAVARLAERTTRIAAIDAELPDVRAAALDLTDLDARIAVASDQVADRGELDTLQEQLVEAARRERSAIDHHGAVLHRYVATTAPRLAAELVPGQPCAVCGSPEHPRPAEADDGAPTPFEDVGSAARLRDVAAQQRSTVEAAVLTVRSRLGGAADTPLDTLRAVADDLRDRRAVAAAAHQLSDALQRERDAAADVATRLDKEHAVLAERIAQAVATCDQRRATLDESTRATADIDVAAISERESALAAAQQAARGLGDLFDAVVNLTGSVEQARRTLDDRLAASGHPSVEAALSVLLDQADEDARRAGALTHRQATAATSAGLSTLEDQGIPEVRPDVEAARVAEAEVMESARGVLEAHTTAVLTHRDAGTALDEHDRIVEASGSIREDHRRSATALRVCTHGGALGMPLRRWVLAIELDRVSAAANVHLQRMTNSRYTLRRRREIGDARRASGLDLEVVDAHTGRARSTTSLSGGEQFQASLALALGLADVVSHGAGASGKRFEALFVDEGFGSLDPTALQEAIGALHQLHATGRMVGAITHVEAMKQDLHVGIQVSRLPDGKGSTLTVHP